MGENLVFYGVQEVNKPENCELLLKDLIQTQLEIDASNMTFDRAHRLGHKTARKPRPIVDK